ncbi:GDSL-type esterase/lipase family protein [Aliivibrio kagoshimensis]|uniref:GDSL-type esterase/lipase family protein n=1 Tax=Aliivibrio kagoshimensis TaxID=2910230 RepID=UPI003D0AF301
MKSSHIRDLVNDQYDRDGAINIEQLYLQLAPISCLDIINEVISVLVESDPQLTDLCLNNQLLPILQSLPVDLSTEQKFTLSYQSLVALNSAQSHSRYLQVTDCHRQFLKPTDVLMFGDSLTEWGPWGDAFPTLNITNRGIAGDTTKGMLGRVQDSLLLEPKTVFVMAGVNDLAKGISVCDIVQHYSDIVQTWTEKEIEVNVQSTLFVGKRLAHLNPQIIELNNQLRKMCQTLGANYIDLTRVLCPNGHLAPMYSCDDLHLNALAYQQWLEVIISKLTK